MAVVVQVMIASEQAGVAFTADPSTGERGHIVIEGAFGQGEVVVSGKVEPDTYVVAKTTMEVLDTRIGHKSFKIVRGPDGRDHTVQLDSPEADARVLDDAALRRIAELAIATERHNACPQDVEWAIASGVTWLVQARPITTLHPHDPYLPIWAPCWSAGCPPPREPPPARCGYCAHPTRGTACSTGKSWWHR